MRNLPGPPDGGALAVELEILRAGTTLVRVHDRDFGELEFNPSPRPGRFSPIGSPPIPTLYAGLDADVALAEGLFRDVPIRPDVLRRYFVAGLNGRVISEIAPTRDLSLIQLHGYGLQRVGVTHGELIETPSAAYGWTARWAEALHEASSHADGLVWMSRRFTGRRTVMLWQEDGRVAAGDLTLSTPARPLWEGNGRELVLEAARRAGIRLLV